jgi:hypothetical protein
MADSPKLLHALIAAAILSASTAALQWSSGAYQSDIGVHADEASHYVTGLMVRDYFLHGLGRNPMAFVQDYYDHYPKVALGHYPPGFYVIEGLWTLVFSTGRASVLILSAAFSALLAWLTWRMLVPHLRPLSAAVAGLLCCALPLVQRYTSIIMSDLMLCVLCLASALAFAKYLETGKTKHSTLFGCLAAAAILTKAGALFLALVPGIALVLAGRFAWCRRLSLWVSVLPIAVLCLPWMLLTYNITHEGMATGSPLEFAREAAPFYLKNLTTAFGFTILLPAIAGIVSLLAGIKTYKTAIDPFWAVMIAIPLSLFAFYSLVPTGLDQRYLLPAAPAVLALSVLGLEKVYQAMPRRFGRLRPVFPAILVLLFFVETFYIPSKIRSGFGDTASAILAKRDAPAETILISSDSTGEGAFIAELAMREPHPSLTVLRSSKELATSDWMGRGYEPQFDSPAELREHLIASGIDWVITDSSIPDTRRLPHHDLLEETMASGSGPFKKVSAHETVRITAVRTDTGTLTVFRKGP